MRDSIFRVHIKPAAKKIRLTKRIGWHTFRHTFSTILNANGENPKVIQELLRHATLKVTMDTQPIQVNTSGNCCLFLFVYKEEISQSIQDSCAANPVCSDAETRGSKD